MFFGTKLIEYQASFYDLLNLWCFYSITAPHYDYTSKLIIKLIILYSFISVVNIRCNIMPLSLWLFIKQVQNILSTISVYGH